MITISSSMTASCSIQDLRNANFVIRNERSCKILQVSVRNIMFNLRGTESEKI